MSFAAFHPVSPSRVRESVGLNFEDFAPGQVFHHRPGITMTQQENVDEALTTLNQAMVHFDEHYAAQTEFERPLMVSTLTLQRAVGLGWKTFGRRKRILGFESIRLTAPVFGGDTLYARTRIVEANAFPEDPACGRLVLEISVSRSDRTDIAVIRCAQLVYRCGEGPLPSLGYDGETQGESRFPAYVEIGEREYVETLGVEFDALSAGLVIEHRPGFGFSWREASERARIAGDHAPALIDPQAAAAVGSGEAAISETWLIGAFAAATTRAFGRVVANLAWENVTFSNPTRDGDFVFAESEILDKRESRTRPDQGILHVRTRGLVRGGGEVCSYERKLLVYRSAQGPHRAAGYV